MKFNFNECFETMMQSHDLDTVIILAHMNPDGDAAGSVMGGEHMAENDKLKLLYLMQILLEQTDEKHIQSPESVRKEYQAYLKEIMGSYEE